MGWYTSRSSCSIATGSPVSVVVVTIVMEYIKDEAYKSLVPIDDILSAVPADQVSEMLVHTNSMTRKEMSFQDLTSC